MNRNQHILQELTELSPMLAGISHANVFWVPEGYFDNLSATVMACIQEEQQPGATIVSASNAAVPDGYFDQLADQILAKIKQENSNEEAEPQLSLMLQGLKQVNPFEVPAGYFDQLADQVADRVELPAVMVGANKVNPFEVPAGYFEQLPASIVKAAVGKQEAKVVQGSFARNIMRYAAAAIIGTGLALGAYQLSNTQPPVVAAATLEPVIEKGMHMDDQKFNETLNSLSEADVLQYLEANGTDADVATLASKLDDNSLPSEEDYLLDDQALDKFIESINSTN